MSRPSIAMHQLSEFAYTQKYTHDTRPRNSQDTFSDRATQKTNPFVGDKWVHVGAHVKERIQAQYNVKWAPHLEMPL